jgi:hypothetical protein
MSEFDNMKHYFEMDAEVNKTRVKLNFQEIAQKSFKFLFDEYGFHLIGANLLLVKYESKDVFVKIYHDRLSYDLELYFGLKANSHEAEIDYSLVEIMKLTGYMHFTNYKARTLTEISEALPQMATFIHKYAIKAIQGDREFYNQLAEYNKKTSFQLNVEWKDRHIKRDGEPAWKRKDYKEVVEVFSKWERYLNEEEKWKLELARKQIK